MQIVSFWFPTLWDKCHERCAEVFEIYIFQNANSVILVSISLGY